MPRIVKVDVGVVEARVRGVFRIAYSETRVARSIYVKVVLDNGVVGWGEGSPSPLITGETVESAVSLATSLSNLLVGLEVPGEEGDALAAVRRLLWRSPAARAALESAILDAVAKTSNVPLCSILGGCRRSELETFYTISLASPEEMARMAKEAFERGFRSLKLKLGGGRLEDLERVKAVRRVVGDDARIIVDANQAWRYTDAQWLIPRLADLGVELVEQPLPSHDLRGIAELSKRSEVRIGVDESVMNIDDLLELWRLGFHGVVNVKVSRVGGVASAAKMLQLVEELGLEPMIGCMVETGVGLLHALHAAATVSPSYVDLDSVLLLENDPSGCQVYDNPPKLSKPRGPGIGCNPQVKLQRMGL